MTTETIETIFDNFEKTVLETCDIWDTDYSSDNWEPEFMTIFGTWQLIVTLDSICNSCDVLSEGLGIYMSYLSFTFLGQFWPFFCHFWSFCLVFYILRFWWRFRWFGSAIELLSYFSSYCCCHNANGITKFTHKCVLFFLVASIIADISLITEKALQDFVVI